MSRRRVEYRRESRKGYWIDQAIPLLKNVMESPGINLMLEGMLVSVLHTLEDPDVISIAWCTDDITCRANEMNISLTRDQAREILHDIFDNHDCDRGIDWHVISDAIENYYDNNLSNDSEEEE